MEKEMGVVTIGVAPDQELIKLAEQPRAIVPKAMAIKVIDEVTLKEANDVWKDLKGLRERVDEFFKPIQDSIAESKRKIEESRKKAIAQRDTIEAGLIRAQEYLGFQMAKYKKEQDRKREEDQRLKKEAEDRAKEEKKKEEEESLKKAIDLEASGQTVAAQIALNTAIDALRKPVRVDIPIAPKVKLEGVRVRTTWSANIIDKPALIKAVAAGDIPMEALDPNMPYLNEIARKKEDKMSVPGVEAVSNITTY